MADVLPGQGEHWTAYSPSVDDSSMRPSFEQAVQRVHSSNQAAFRAISQDIFNTAGIKNVTIHNAVGDTQQWGSENGLLHIIRQPTSPQVGRYLASWHGLLGNQKAVIHFIQADDGPDSVYQIHVPSTNLGQIRAALDAHQIAFRTLLPSRDGTDVVLYDPHRDLRPNVATFAESVNAPIREATGTGEFLGDPAGESRTAARSKYRAVINAFENSSQVRASPQYRDDDVSARPRSQPGSLYQQAAKGRHVRVRIRFAATSATVDYKGHLVDVVVDPSPEGVERWMKQIDTPEHHRLGKHYLGGFVHEGHMYVFHPYPEPNESWTGQFDPVVTHDHVFSSLGLKGTLPLARRFIVDPNQAELTLSSHLGNDVSGRLIRPTANRLGFKRVFAAVKAPAGGAVVRGVSYTGGEMLPAMNTPTPVPNAATSVVGAANGSPPVTDEPSQIPAAPPDPAPSPRVTAEFTPKVTSRAKTPDMYDTFVAKPASKQYTDTFRQVSDFFMNDLSAHSFAAHGLTDQDKVAFTTAAHQAWGQLPQSALERFQRNVRAYKFFSDAHALTMTLAAEGMGVEPGHIYLGGWSPSNGVLYLDGHSTRERLSQAELGDRGITEKNREWNADRTEHVQQIYLHEFGHAIDGRNATSKLTNSGGWRKAWRDELSANQITEYGSINPIEGFAEFARMIYTQRDSVTSTKMDKLQDLIREYPLCSQFFQAARLWPDSKR